MNFQTAKNYLFDNKFICNNNNVKNCQRDLYSYVNIQTFIFTSQQWLFHFNIKFKFLKEFYF